MASIQEPEDRDLAAGLTAPPGLPFLQWLVGHLARELGCRFAFLWERSGEMWERVRLLAGSERGRPFERDLDLPFADLPCERADPANAFLQQLGAQSCVGLALADAAGRQLGHVTLLDDRRCPDP